MPPETFINVAVEAPIPQPLTYLSPQGPLPEGASVIVPLGHRKTRAIVLGPSPNPPKDIPIKSLLAVNPHRPLLHEDYMKWLEKLSQYYMYPLGLIAPLAFPPLEKKTGRKTRKKEVIPEVFSKVPPPPLTSEQKQVVQDILKFPNFSVHLLHGVTGSGKTEVYLQLLEKVIHEKKQALVLVPEISLTPQLILRFSQRFPQQVAVIHSHLTPREKTNQWWSMVDHKKSILIGARSALFCPLPKLGLIILDEEHEASFKQEDHFRYHARDAAIILGQIKNIPVILGSATPSLESWHNAQSGKYHLHQMKHRVSGRPLPTIEVIDLKKQEKEASLPFWLSQPLYNKLSESLEKKEQSALFLNRRGMAQSAFCQSCGHVAHCPNCDISLTLHSNKYLVCHYCNYTKGFTEKCPECGENTVNPVGLGTEKVYQDLTSLFPQARITRADRDEIQSREDIENLVSQMEKHQVDILVGTQMIAKGLDFPKLNFVGLVLADVGFNLPDFRSNERNFQLITQVSGRSGRHINEPGQVYIQAYNPQHMSLLYAKNCDYTGFAKKELEHRKELFYPPFSRLGCLRFQGIHLKKVRLAAEQAAQRALQLQQQYPQHYSQIQVLGPAPMPLSKINNKYRYFLLCKSPLTPPLLLQTFFKQLLGDEKWKPTGVSLFIDIDPINLM